MSSSHLNVYEVVRTTRTRHTVRVLARTAAEACRKADEHITAAVTIAKPWSADELDRRIEAIFMEKAAREDVIT